MEVICSSETSVAIQQTTRRHIPEDDTLHNHRCENLKSYYKVGDFRSFLSRNLGLSLPTLHITNELINSMEQSPSKHASTCWASQETPSIVQSLKVHYRVFPWVSEWSLSFKSS
jgi:hypothetical protein